MMQKLINICANSLRRRNLQVMIGKVLTRWKERSGGNDPESAARWAANHAEELERFVTGVNAPLWKETQKTCAELARKAQIKLDQLETPLGGGGHYPLLYFLTRHLNPNCVIETGVAAGWSSQAILSALRTNGKNGVLYSSDFPYFRHKNPEKLIGYVVDEDLMKSWGLFIDGDKNNLPRIIDEVEGRVGLFHYDSDKSYQGRTFAYDQVAPKLSDDAIVVFDDIQDNFHFKDFVAEHALPFKIFEFEGKYIGLSGPYFSARG